MITEVILQVLFPRACVVCGKLLVLPRRWYRMLYGEDKAEKEKIRQAYVCGRCRAIPGICTGSFNIKAWTGSGIKRCINGFALMPHSDSAKKILYDLKFHDRRVNAEFAGFEMAARLGEHIEEGVIFPVPLHKSRLRQRGFNQSELIAESFAYWSRRLYGKQFTVERGYLHRIKQTRPQKDLKAKERKTNVKGAFALDKKAEAHESIVLIDDIYTSGATICECAQVLSAASGTRVSFICVSAVQ